MLMRWLSRVKCSICIWKWKWDIRNCSIFGMIVIGLLRWFFLLNTKIRCNRTIFIELFNFIPHLFDITLIYVQNHRCYHYIQVTLRVWKLSIRFSIDFSIWIDDNFQVISSLRTFASRMNILRVLWWNTSVEKRYQMQLFR